MEGDPRESTLVLGGSGFLGLHVVRAALEGGGAVSCASRHPRVGELLTRLRFEGARPEEIRVDLERAGAATELLERLAPDRVVVAAALSRVGDCEQAPELARALNERAPGEVAVWCARSGARLVHVSTDLVFGDRPAPPDGFAEGDPPGPVSTYGRSKAAGERAVLNADPSALVVRLPLLFGSSAGRGLGASDAPLEAARRGETVRLFEDEWRTPLDVEHAARALLELARSGERGLLHVAGPLRANRLELGRAVLAAFGLASASERLVASTRAEAGLADRPADVSLDARRARSLLRTPLPDFERALRGS